MTDDVPPPLPAAQVPPIRSVSDLDRFWRSIKGRRGFSQPQLWCALLSSAGEMTPFFIAIEDCPEVPRAEHVDSLFRTLSSIVVDSVPGGSVALMFARPGSGAADAGDRGWARALTDGGRRAPVDVWPVFLADDVRVRVAAPDDLVA